MRGIRNWKLDARVALKGNYTLPVLGTVIVAGLNFLGSMLASSLFPGNSVWEIILSLVCSFIITLVFCVFSAGLYYMYLNIARGQNYDLGNLLYFFKNHPDRVIVAAFVLAMIEFLVSVPLNFYAYTAEMGTTMEAQTGWAVKYLLLLLLALVLNFLLTIPFAMTYYLLADDLQLDGMGALRKSVHIMKGKIGKYLLLEVSFLPLLILSVFTLYIGLLWVVPYMEMSSVMFYRDLLGEKQENAAPEQQVVDSYHSDDFNSEA